MATHRRADYERIVAATRAAIDKDAFAAAWEAGRTLTTDLAVAEAQSIADALA